MKPQLEQTPNKVESNLPATDSKVENPYIKWIGFVCVALGLIGAVFAARNRKLNPHYRTYTEKRQHNAS
ncbi:hypothetical protein FT638_17050 [Bacillus cereus]|nr:hypothetical protein [Bacillus cereus]